MKLTSKSLLLVDTLVILALMLVMAGMLWLVYSTVIVTTPPAEEGAMEAWALSILENTDMSRHAR